MPSLLVTNATLDSQRNTVATCKSGEHRRCSYICVPCCHAYGPESKVVTATRPLCSKLCRGNVHLMHLSCHALQRSSAFAVSCGLDIACMDVHLPYGYTHFEDRAPHKAATFGSARAAADDALCPAIFCSAVHSAPVSVHLSSCNKPVISHCCELSLLESSLRCSLNMTSALQFLQI